MKILLPALAALLIAQPATTVRAACLEDATNFALKLCGELNNEGVRTQLTGKADAEASISKWVSAFLKLNGSIGGAVDIDKYVGPVRDQLAVDRFNVLDCRRDMAKVAIATQCKKDVLFKTCARPEFGFNNWGSTAEREGNSGWRPGGHTQAEWCSELAATALRENGVSSTHTWKTLGSDEDRKKELDGKAKYNYKCRVQVQWNPIYNVRTDPLCGIESASN
jgi:hypothetical protein